MFKWFRRKKNVSSSEKIVIEHEGVFIEESSSSDGSLSYRLADIEQTIGGVRQLRSNDIEEMSEKKHDLDFQYGLCRDMMADGDILPFPFERAAILLRKNKMYTEELDLCDYVKRWCVEAESKWDGISAKHWLSPSLQKCISRIERAEILIEKQLASNQRAN